MRISSRLVKLVLLLLLVGLVSYLFYLNPVITEVHYSSDKSFKAPLALVLIVAFSVGLVVAALGAAIIALRHKLDDWKLKRQSRLVHSHREQLTQAREQLAIGNFAKARKMFERILANDPDEIMARIHLAEIEYKSGDLKAALAVLDQARLEQRSNLELATLAAQINDASGNYTAALDSMGLVLKHYPDNYSVLEKMINYAAKLERYDRALELLHELMRISPYDEQDSLARWQAKLRLAQADILFADDSRQHHAAVEGILKSCNTSVPALASLAAHQARELDFAGATKSLTRAYKLSGSILHLNSLTSLWLQAGQSDKAIVAIKNALIPASENPKRAFEGGLFLASVLSYLGQKDEALNEFNQAQQISDPGEHVVEAMLIRSVLAPAGPDPKQLFNEFAQIIAKGTLQHNWCIYTPH